MNDNMLITAKFNKELKKYLPDGFQKDPQVMNLIRGVALNLIKEHEEEFVEMLFVEIDSFIHHTCMELVNKGILDCGVDENGEVVYWDKNEDTETDS